MLHDRRRFLLFNLWDRSLIFLGLKDNTKYMEIILENIPNHVKSLKF